VSSVQGLGRGQLGDILTPTCPQVLRTAVILKVAPEKPWPSPGHRCRRHDSALTSTVLQITQEDPNSGVDRAQGLPGARRALPRWPQPFRLCFVFETGSR
jgi:hypothetical protein